MRALVLIDIQNDFMPGGSLAVQEGDKIVPLVNRLMPKFDLVVATQDWHPANHISFASNHAGKKPFEKIKIGNYNQTLWPDHCVQGTPGADFHQDLNLVPVEAIFRKGTDSKVDSYSGFFDNNRERSSGLAGYLREKNATDLYFVGLAADICVYFTLSDARSMDFSATLIEDGTRAIDKDNFNKVKKDLLSKGARIIQSSEIL